jgi:PD-(D/E)XK endonuclease
MAVWYTLGAVKDTNGIGAVTEGRVLAALLAAGHAVAVPFGVARYDLVLDMDGDLQRVQCKTGRLRNGAVVFNLYSVRRGGTPGKFDNAPYRGQVDLFGVFCPDTDKVYLVPIDDRVSEIRLRVEPARNNQQAGTRWAADYEVHARSPQ